MTVKEIYQIIHNFAPFDICTESDNAGLLIGKENDAVQKVLVTLDADYPAMEHAIREGCNLIVSHHPFFFSGESSVTDATPQGKKILFALENHLNIICAHTNLDSCEGGINDTLGKLLNFTVTEKFVPTRNGGFLGRIGTSGFTGVNEFLSHAAAVLNTCPRYIVANPDFNRIAWVSGSGASCMKEALACHADTLVTGDVKYSNFMDALQAGINLIDLGHFETEQIIVPVLGNLLRSHGLDVSEHIVCTPVQTWKE